MNHIENSILKIDYLKKYNLLKIALVAWILFIPLKNTLYQVIVVLILFMFLYHAITFRRFQTLLTIFKHSKDLFVAFGIILLSMFISALVGMDTAGNLADLVKFFYRYIAILFILLYFYHEQFFSRKFLLSAIFFMFTFYALDGLYQYFIQYDLLSHKPLEGGGLTGPTFSRNIFGLMMAIYSSLLFYTLLHYQPKKYSLALYFILVSFFFLSLFLLFNSLSRASWVSFIVFIGLYSIFNMKKILFSQKTLLLFLVMTFIIFIIFYTNSSLLARLNELLQGNDANRFSLWKHAITFIKEHLWFGYGVNSSLTLFENLAAGRVHNMFLEIALYLGLFGTSAYIFLFIHIYKTIYTIKHHYYALFLTSFLVLLQFDGSLVNSKIHVSFFIIYLLVIYSHTLDNNTNSRTLES